MQNDRDVLEVILVYVLFSILFSVLQPYVSSLPNHLLSVRRLAFIHDPAVCRASQLLREPDVREIGLAFVLIKCTVLLR